MLKLKIYTVILAVAALSFGIWMHNDKYKLGEAYDILKSGKYLDYSRRIELDKMAGKGDEDAKALYWLVVFLERNRHARDVIFSETVAAGVNYSDIFDAADSCFKWEYSGQYQEFFYEVKSHVDALRQKNPENVRFDSEEKACEGRLPHAGMKIIYFDVCSLGKPSISKIEKDIVWGGSHTAYDWIVDGEQIFRADVINGYVYATYDYRYKLAGKNNSYQNNSSGSSGSSNNSYSYYSDPYDADKYHSVDDFADDWEDDFDSWDDAFDYWEENY